MRTESHSRATLLREQMKRQQVDALIVPRFDAHQGEYVAPCDARLAWLTGFTGTAGFAIVTPQTIEMFVDGRYSVQVTHECAGEGFGFHHLLDQAPDRWLAGADPAWIVGYDAMLLPPTWAGRFRVVLGKRLKALDDNLIDSVWHDRPPPPNAPIRPFPLQLAGRSPWQKRDDLTQAMSELGADLLIETQPDNIAWFLNLRDHVGARALAGRLLDRIGDLALDAGRLIDMTGRIAGAAGRLTEQRAENVANAAGLAALRSSACLLAAAKQPAEKATKPTGLSASGLTALRTAHQRAEEIAEAALRSRAALLAALRAAHQRTEKVADAAALRGCATRGLLRTAQHRAEQPAQTATEAAALLSTLLRRALDQGIEN